MGQLPQGQSIHLIPVMKIRLAGNGSWTSNLGGYWENGHVANLTDGRVVIERGVVGLYHTSAVYQACLVGSAHRHSR